MKKHLKVVAALTLVAVLGAFGLVYAQVTPLPTDIFSRLNGNGPAPVLSACGTTPTIVGGDSSGRITIGTGTPAACTLTFSAAFKNAPTCSFNDETTAGKTNAGTTYQVVPTTTAVTVTFQAATVNGDKVGYTCIGF